MDLLNKIETDTELLAIVDKIAAKRIARKRELKTKHKTDESFIQCSAGVKLTKKAAKSIIEDKDDNTSMYVMTYIDGDKEHTNVFKQCSAKCKNDNDYCGRHQKRFDDDPVKIIDFRNPENYGGYKLTSLDDDFLKTKPRAKRSTKKKPAIEPEELSELVVMMELIRGDPEMMKLLKEKKKLLEEEKEEKEEKEEVKPSLCLSASKSSVEDEDEDSD